jgi:hypothetical protein
VPLIYAGVAYTSGYFSRVIASFKQTPTKIKHTQAGDCHSLGVLCLLHAGNL